MGSNMTKPSILDEFIAAKVVEKTAALPDATVKTFLGVLASKITQQDKKEYEKEVARGGRGNIYRLGLLLEAKGKVEDAVSAYLGRDDAEAMEALKKALKRNFNDNFPPLKNLLKQIEAWESKKKKPSLV
jgi:hypothetical protein